MWIDTRASLAPFSTGFQSAFRVLSSLTCPRAVLRTLLAICIHEIRCSRYNLPWTSRSYCSCMFVVFSRYFPRPVSRFTESHPGVQKCAQTLAEQEIAQESFVSVRDWSVTSGKVSALFGWIGLFVQIHLFLLRLVWELLHNKLHRDPATLKMTRN